jgi:phage gp37-like protein
MHEFEQLENAVIAGLEPLKDAGLKTLETYSGQLDVDDIEAVTFQFPCIYVVAGSLALADANRYDKYRAELSLIIGDRNVRGSAAAARGDASSPGVYALLEAARAKLHRQKILNGWTPLYLISEDSLVYAPEASICLYTATYEMRTVK